MNDHPRLRVEAVSVSLDGFMAGPGQDREHPLGANGPDLFEWFFPTRTFQSMHGDSERGETGVDDDAAARGFENVGAWILGRNMFGPIRGPWPDDDWKGWWGDEPPYHVPVFVLTHHARAPLSMRGGTVFHFVTDGIEAALARARAAAGERDVRVGAGAHVLADRRRVASCDLARPARARRAALPRPRLARTGLCVRRPRAGQARGGARHASQARMRRARLCTSRFDATHEAVAVTPNRTR